MGVSSGVRIGCIGLALATVRNWVAVKELDFKLPYYGYVVIVTGFPYCSNSPCWFAEVNTKADTSSCIPRFPSGIFTYIIPIESSIPLYSSHIHILNPKP